MRSAILIAALLLGCGGDECMFNSECDVGSYCSMGACTSDCSADVPCPTGQSCNTFGQCVGGEEDAGVDAGREEIDGGRDAGMDGGMDAGTDAGPPDEVCTPSDGTASADEDGDGAIDEGCAWHYGVPHPVVHVHVRDGDHYFPRFSAAGMRVYYGAPNASGVFVPHVAERTDRGSRFMPPREVPGNWGTSHAYTVTLRDDRLEAFVQSTNGTAQQHVYRAVRGSTGELFGALERVEASVIGTADSRHPFVTPDGLELFFNAYTTVTDGRIYRARRPDLSSPFGTAELVVLPGAVPGVSEESPSLSGRDFFFTRLEGTTYRSFRARRSADGTTYSDVVELTADIGNALAPSYSPEVRELWFNAQPGTPWSPTNWSLWRVEVCRDGPCPERAIECAAPAVRSPDGLHCYRAGDAAAAWADARAACGADHLASLHSRAEMDLVWSSFSAVAAPWLWMGAFDDMSGVAECNTDKNCPWGWVSSEPWTTAALWSPTEPSNSEAAEDCMVLWDGIGMGDASCEGLQQYVCEAELWPVW